MWADLQRDILEDLAGHYRGYDHELDTWLHHAVRLRETKARFYDKLRVDTRRREHYRTVNRAREQRRYQEIRRDPVALARLVAKLHAAVDRLKREQPEEWRQRRRRACGKYYRRRQDQIAERLRSPEAKAAKRAYDQRRYLARKAAR